MTLAHCLPVGRVEASRSERSEPVDVVDLRCEVALQLRLGLALLALAVRMRLQVLGAGLAPCPAVATSGGLGAGCPGVGLAGGAPPPGGEGWDARRWDATP